jgi:Flp pilus assembly protein TadG
MTSKARTSGTEAGRGVLQLLRDRRAVAAVEFAFIAPLLLCLYFVTMEVSQGIETNKKVGRIGSMVADLVTQQQTITRDELDAILEIGGSILAPYNRSQPEIVVTEIEITGDESTPAADVEVKVAWSRKLSGEDQFATPFTKGSQTTVPEKLKIPGTYLIRVSSKLDYRPVLTWSASQKAGLGLAAAFDNIQMDETYYLRPRTSKDVRCDTC